MIRGKSLKSICHDVAEGFVAVNPLFLKPLDAATIKDLLAELIKVQAEIRAEKFPHHDVMSIRKRNVRLSRLHGATMVLKNFARERRMNIY